MSHTVAVGQFEGPLGVLLELIERRKLEVSSVSVGQITSEYLARVRSLQPASVDDLTEFLQLGARLLYIKSLALLPKTSAEEQTQELQQLSIELAEYRRIQAGAKLLADRSNERTWQRPISPRIGPSELPMPDIALDTLAEAFTRALKFAPVAPEKAVIKPHLTLDSVTTRLRKLLSDGFALHTVIEGCQNRLEIIVTFLALLELVKDGSARVSQSNQFEPILVEPARA